MLTMVSMREVQPMRAGDTAVFIFSESLRNLFYRWNSNRSNTLLRASNTLQYRERHEVFSGVTGPVEFGSDHACGSVNRLGLGIKQRSNEALTPQSWCEGRCAFHDLSVGEAAALPTCRERMRSPASPKRDVDKS